MRRQSGFTLVELMIVMAIMGVLASMAIVSVWRARSAANESAAIGALRTITSGQIAFSSTCGSGNFAPDLPTLGPVGVAAFLPPDLTSAATVQKSGYFIEVSASLASVAGRPDCNGNPTQTGFYAWAEPVLFGTTGNRSFATLTPTNVIWQVYGAAAPGEPFGAPAVPIR